MTRTRVAAKYGLAILMIAAGIMHFVNPSLFKNTIWLYSSMQNEVMFAIGLCQILIGILFLVSAYSGSTVCKKECGCAVAYSDDDDVQSMMKRLAAEKNDIRRVGKAGSPCQEQIPGDARRCLLWLQGRFVRNS